MAYPIGVPRCEAKGTGPGRCWRAGTTVIRDVDGIARPACPQHAQAHEEAAQGANR